VEWSVRRGNRRPSGAPLVGSVLFHVVVFALAAAATRGAPEPLTFITYEVEIVSPPPAPAEEVAPTAAPEEELVVERPDPQPEPEPETAVPEPDAQPAEQKPEPESPEPDPAPPEPEVEPEPETEPASTTPDPDAEPSEESGEDLEVRMEGLRRDFPEYYGNIIRQIRRCFRPSPGLPGGLQTTVYFVIRKDGAVTDTRFVEQSGNPDFDYEALAAIADCAEGRFGDLPDELPYERLPIQFTFKPSG